MMAALRPATPNPRPGRRCHPLVPTVRDWVEGLAVGIALAGVVAVGHLLGAMWR